jgi:Ca-activated chloride channel family protein
MAYGNWLTAASYTQKPSNMKKTLLFMLMLVVLAGFRANTSRTISGTVYDDHNQTLPGVSVRVEGTSTGTQTSAAGKYVITVPEGKTQLRFTALGYIMQIVKIEKKDTINVWLKADNASLNEVVVTGYATQRKSTITGSVSTINQTPVRLNGKDYAGGNVAQATQNLPANVLKQIQINNDYSYQANRTGVRATPGNESYSRIIENQFEDPKTTPLSTFAVDVDAASYSNVRRYINSGQLPPKNAVRIEELINYFHYDLPEPESGKPVAIQTELSATPWNPQHQLVRIGLKAKNVKTDKLPPSNLVFLLDVSGSMAEPNKLSLVKPAMKMLVDQLRPIDNVAIVVYAGEAGVKLESTPGNEKDKIKDAIDRLSASGSTAGGAGIMMAYDIAKKKFIKGGNNRIILATDGDFNVGASSDKDMEQLIEEERGSGVSISILGFGMGNLKDSKMERMADKGHGNYAYIDNITEATKSMVSEFGGTLFTVAKDVKLQVEFNPAKVQAYRLLGYEDRLMAKEDFNNDSKVAGDMGVNHTVTALYEIIPVGVKDSFTTSVDPLKYQKPAETKSANASSEVMTVKFRYKDPESEVSKLEAVTVDDKPVIATKTSDDFRFAAAVAEYGLLLRDSQFKQNARFDQLITMAKSAKGKDDDGYRAEFIRLAESTKNMMKENSELVMKK